MSIETPISGMVKRYLIQVKEMYGDNLFFEDAGISFAIQSSFNTPLTEFEKAINKCQKCPLGETRNKFVFGVGDPSAKLVFIGEAPGRDEDRLGEPFVGRAGKLLDKILSAINMTREEVYICNILKCRPPDNRTPHSEEIETCLPYLETQLKIINPKLIVALGATAAHTLLSSKTSLGSLRSNIWKWQDIDLIVTYHPAALLRNPNFKRPAWEDFQWIQSIISRN